MPMSFFDDLTKFTTGELGCRVFAYQHNIQQNTKRIDVRACIGLSKAKLLRSGIADRSDGLSVR